jgi:ribosome-associated protein
MAQSGARLPPGCALPAGQSPAVTVPRLKRAGWRRSNVVFFAEYMMAVIDPREVEFIAIRAQGPGGQNVNKVSSAIHLRYDIVHSSLPEIYKERLLALRDQRITREGVIVLKAQQSRSQEQNRAEALRRLQEIVDGIVFLPPVRRATRPTRGSQRRRLDGKSTHGEKKQLRAKVNA